MKGLCTGQRGSNGSVKPPVCFLGFFFPASKPVLFLFLLSLRGPARFGFLIPVTAKRAGLEGRGATRRAPNAGWAAGRRAARLSFYHASGSRPRPARPRPARLGQPDDSRAAAPRPTPPQASYKAGIISRARVGKILRLKSMSTKRNPLNDYNALSESMVLQMDSFLNFSKFPLND